MSRNRGKRRTSSSRNSPKTAELFKEEYSQELVKLANILETSFYDYCSDLSALHRAAKLCSQLSGDRYGYSLERMVFRLDEASLRRSLPRSITAVSLELNLEIKGKCNLDDSINDPFLDFLLEIILNGKRRDNELPLKGAWHLDRDEPEEDDGLQDFIHPCYHFQYGGRKMWDAGFDYGHALILEMPRLAHPPMDAILAIDFILVNYYPRSKTAFREEENYQQLLISAQKRVWKPYAQALASLWDTDSRSTNPWLATSIWPQLVSLRL